MDEKTKDKRPAFIASDQSMVQGWWSLAIAFQAIREIYLAKLFTQNSSNKKIGQV